MRERPVAEQRRTGGSCRIGTRTKTTEGLPRLHAHNTVLHSRQNVRNEPPTLNNEALVGDKRHYMHRTLKRVRSRVMVTMYVQTREWGQLAIQLIIVKRRPICSSCFIPPRNLVLLRISARKLCLQPRKLGRAFSGE